MRNQEGEMLLTGKETALSIHRKRRRRQSERRGLRASAPLRETRLHQRSRKRPSTRGSRRSGDRSRRNMPSHAPHPTGILEHRVSSRSRTWPLRLVGAERSLFAPRPIGSVYAEARGEAKAKEAQQRLDHRYGRIGAVSAGSSTLGADRESRDRQAQPRGDSQALRPRRSSG
jgi:hypothetical protein